MHKKIRAKQFLKLKSIFNISTLEITIAKIPNSSTPRNLAIIKSVIADANPPIILVDTSNL